MPNISSNKPPVTGVGDLRGTSASLDERINSEGAPDCTWRLPLGGVGGIAGRCACATRCPKYKPGFVSCPARGGSDPCRRLCERLDEERLLLPRSGLSLPGDNSGMLRLGPREPHLASRTTDDGLDRDPGREPVPVKSGFGRYVGLSLTSATLCLFTSSTSASRVGAGLPKSSATKAERSLTRSLSDASHAMHAHEIIKEAQA
mmetsp:Transcript_13159/g.24266  ORF Transcript_13159/g.24266 Transcript_13159/m.24266 type:complete len:203 (+) Transcript_13159:1733-2341(+)